MHKRYVILSVLHRSDKQVSLFYGMGSTLMAAKEYWFASGGRTTQTTRVWLFTSDKPFAPPERPATPGEADAYVNQLGEIRHNGCAIFAVDPKLLVPRSYR